MHNICKNDSVLFNVLPGILGDVCGGSQSVGSLRSQRARDLLGLIVNVHAQHQLKAFLITRCHRDSCWTHRL